MIDAPLRLRFANATLDDLPFIDRLRRRDSRALGFLSTTALAEKIRLGFVRLAVIVESSSDDRAISPTPGAPPAPWCADPRAGFLLHGSLRRPEVRIFQLAVEPGFRQQGVARRLLADLLRHCRRMGIAGVSLRCRQELPANRFWHRAGFVLHDLEAGRRGALYVWVRRLTRPPLKNKATEVATGKLQNKATAPADVIASAGRHDSLQFHSRWRRCPNCGGWTCGSWSVRGVRRGICQRCGDRTLGIFTCGADLSEPQPSRTTTEARRHGGSSESP